MKVFPCTVGDHWCVLSQLPKKGYLHCWRKEDRLGEFPEAFMRMPTYLLGLTVLVTRQCGEDDD